ncbi:MAG: tripartite tricarboxylate transporter substrate binding protein [Hyphomicrobiales bacterium]|nr:tripartite tricarboxylate transporter substrate binding protein [Hyphomicrobiales bacterium]MBV8241893.1 tripartite tricarboxylate transporter substrate binding protein [Hyphomicrobiales bacterium]MBV8288374.1 tripartite tricarboxylate transporter substrate binding protein [Hyphomicrobiales bacterium]
MTTMRVISLILVGMGTSILAAPVSAETYPNQVVRIVVPFSAGSITDGLARILAEKLADVWKQQVIVENRPGLPGTTGVAKSAPDGYTLMLTSNGHTIAGAINKSIQFDPVKDFAGVSRVAAVPLVAIVPPDLPAKTLDDFITLAKERPGQLNFSSAGVASTSYLSAEIFKQDAKINILHIPYKGAPEATTAVIRNDAQMYFAPIPATQELSATGKVRAIAINSAARVAQLPDVPTIAETLPNYKYESWFGVFAPAGTPQPILSKVNRDIAKVLQMPDVKEKLFAQGSIPAPTTPAEFDAINEADTERYGKILKDAGITPQ